MSVKALEIPEEISMPFGFHLMISKLSFTKS